MIITKDVLKNLKLKKGEISEKRCQEINAMKIKNPYYPWSYFSCTEEHFTIRDRYLVHSEDERIVYINAFHPLPVLRRESSEDYDDIFIMVIDNEYVSDLMQLMYIDIDNRPAHIESFFGLARDILDAAPSTGSYIKQICDLVTTSQFYHALKTANQLIDYEKELTAHVE